MIGVDPDNDTLRYRLTKAPGNMTIDSVTGEIKWLTYSSYVGHTFDVQVAVSDGKGGKAIQDFAVLVVGGKNSLPVFVSRPDTMVMQNDVWTYALRAMDFDDDSLRFALKSGPAGILFSNDTLRYITDQDRVGRHLIAVAVTDGVDTVFQQFRLTVQNVNDSPVITSKPKETVTTGAQYLYQVIATDPDNDILSFVLTAGPSGMSISATGLITCPPPMMAPAQVAVEVRDPHGLSASQVWTLTPLPDTVPPSVTISTKSSLVAPGEDAVITVLAFDDAPIVSRELFVNESPVMLDDLNSFLLHTSIEGTISLLAAATDENGNRGTATLKRIVTRDADNEPPGISISYTPQFPGAGDRIVFTIETTDNRQVDSGRIWLSFDSVYLPVIAGQAEGIALKRGNFEALATAYDSSGNYAEARVNIVVSVPAIDTKAPIASIVSPSDTVVLLQQEIQGTATDENFAYYTLSYALSDTPVNYIEFYRSTVPVLDGCLGTLDASKMENGNYRLCCAVYDRYGNSTRDEVRVRIDGQAKIGTFALSFEDMHIPLPGLNLEVSRTYDSRNKVLGDFGYGWSMGLRSIRLTESYVQGSGWDIEQVNPQNPLEGYQVTGLVPHTVSIAIPGGRTQVFEAAPVLMNKYDPTYLTMQYRPRPGTYGTLRSLDGGEGVVMGGTVYSVDGDFQKPYDPGLYELTFMDGTRYLIDQAAGGVTQVIDVNGNIINIGNSGISHSSGGNLSINRDSFGRIVSIADGSGRNVVYSYDPHGNLADVTDPNGNITRFKYAPNHYLMEIIDTRGVRATRTEYDSTGRMVRQISPAGDTLTLSHDLDNSTERTKDFNGNEMEYTYDTRGNVLAKTALAKRTDGSVTRLSWEYTYDAQDNLLTTTNPDNTTRSSTWDNKGSELTATDERGYTTERTYNDRGQVLTETDPLNRVTRYEYGPSGNLLRIIGPDGAVTNERSYALKGTILTEKDGEGNLTQYEYDSQGRMIGLIDPLGRRIGYVLDARGQTVAEVDVEGDSTRYVFDANGNQVMKVNANGDTTRNTYNVFNKVATQTDALGNMTRFEYDLFGQLKKTVAADSTYTQRTYDSQGNVKTTADEAGRVTTFEYDHESRVVKTILNDGSFTTVEYDSRGRRKCSVDALTRLRQLRVKMRPS